MIDLNDYIEKQRLDSKTSKRKFYNHYCNNCNKSRGYQRKGYDDSGKNPGLCHACVNANNYDRSADRKKYTNVNFDDYIIRQYSGKNCKHYMTSCIDCGQSKGYLTKQSWLIKCQYCSAGYNENEVRKIFEAKFNKSFPNVRPNFLKNPQTGRNLELDGYCEELKLAFEYDGRQHYEPWNKNKPEELIEVQKRDKLKDKLCKENDITLIRIPYWEKDRLNAFIKEKINEVNIYVERYEKSIRDEI